MKDEQEMATMVDSVAETRRNKEKLLYQQELEKQLEERERRKQEAYKEFLREKLLIDEIVRKIYEEDEAWVFIGFRKKNFLKNLICLRFPRANSCALN